MNVTTEETPLPPGDDAEPVETQRHLRSVTALVFAAACGLAVGNVYYAQPLLDAMARDIGLDLATAGLIVTLTQVGYAFGLIILVPLGDRLDRRQLVIGQFALSAIALVIVATAQSERVLLAGMVAVGFLAVVIQVLVAFAATLAAPSERGKSVGIVTSGVVIGILGARFVSGILADLGGWRLVYLTSAGMMLVMAAILSRVVPRHAPKTGEANYFGILRSIPALIAQDPVILLRSVFALLIFAAFSTLWTSLALPLSTEPFALSHTQIGLFGLVGVCGALAASGAGTLADRGFATWVTGASLALLLASWALIAMLPFSMAALVAGVALLDLAIQAVHVTNQSIIFSRHPDMKSRLVGGYMVFYSIGSAIGAIASTTAYARAGWAGVAWLGATFSASALALWAMTLVWTPARHPQCASLIK